jgi:hypothetical protein
MAGCPPAPPYLVRGNAGQGLRPPAASTRLSVSSFLKVLLRTAERGKLVPRKDLLPRFILGDALLHCSESSCVLGRAVAGTEVTLWMDRGISQNECDLDPHPAAGSSSHFVEVGGPHGPGR